MRHISADDQNHSHHLGLYVVLVLAMVLTACTTPTPLPISTNTLKPTHYPTAINVPETTPLSPTPISLEPTPNSIPHNLPELVYDINPGSAVLVKAPSDFVELNGQLYFIAGDEDGHRRLWRTDGTTVGTKVVINIDTGTIGDGVLGLTRAGSNLFFFAASGPSNTFELWRSDGTLEGTEVIAPLGYDPNTFTPENYRPQIAAVGATLYFVSGIDQRGGTLYRSDGTKAGTLPLLFVESLRNNPLPIRSLTPSGDLLFFEAQHHSPTKSTLELAIWRTDGTKKGTQLIYEGSYGDLTSVGRLVFFPGFNEGLLVSDGTLERTHMVKSIRIGTGESLRYGTALGDQFFFVLANTELWTSDGTQSGTKLVWQSAVNTGKIINITNIGSRLLITTGFDDHDYGYHAFVLWQSDGTGAGTTEIRTFHPRLADTPPYGFTLLNDTIYFGADDQGSGTELWQSDGTKDGTHIVREIGAGSANGLPEWNYIHGTPPSVDNEPPDGTFEAALLGKQLLFTASDGRDGLTLWRTDGSDSGTVQMLQGSPGSASSMPDPLLAEALALGDRVLFLANDGAHGTEWWSSNGTNSGTMLLKDINSSLSGSMYGPTVIGDRMYFQATTEQGYHLWVSDGTNQGTTPVSADTAEQMLIRAIVRAGDGAQMSAIPYVMANIGGTVYYYTVDPEYSDQRALFLWRSDGSSVGAQKVSSAIIVQMGFFTPWPEPPVRFGKGIVFAALDEQRGWEPWFSDGTDAGTRMIKNINTDLQWDFPPSFTVVGKLVFFIMDTRERGHELWVSDGSEVGTRLVYEIDSRQVNTSTNRPTAPGQRLQICGTPRLLVRGNAVYFRAADGAHGCELWSTDGSPTGTRMVADITPQSTEEQIGYSDRWRFTPLVIGPDDQLYFTADDGTHGVELWATDGTSAGTTLVADINTGPQSSDPREFYSIMDRLYFTANDGTHGVELWVTDGTTAGTTLVADINPGKESADPSKLTGAGDWLYFSANDRSHGWELWKLPLR